MAIHAIEIPDEVIPAGWRVTAFRPPENGEWYLEPKSKTILQLNWCRFQADEPRLIVERIPTPKTPEQRLAALFEKLAEIDGKCGGSLGGVTVLRAIEEIRQAVEG